MARHNAQSVERLTKQIQKLTDQARRRRGCLLPYPKIIFVEDESQLEELEKTAPPGAVLLPAWAEEYLNAATPGSRIYELVRYLVAHGGRGSSKSATFCRILLILVIWHGQRWITARQTQTSLEDSSYQELIDIINTYGWGSEVRILRNQIRSNSGGKILFKGLSDDNSIRSIANADGVFVEEAENVKVWQALIPTLRKPHAKIMVAFNPIHALSDTYQRFVSENAFYPEYSPTSTQDNAMICRQVNFDKNPWFRRSSLYADHLLLLEEDPEMHAHVYGGECAGSVGADVIIPTQRIQACLDLHDLLANGMYAAPADAVLIGGYDPAGCDGAANDPSAFAVVDEFGVLRHLDEWKSADVLYSADIAMSKARNFTLSKTFYDAGGVGLGVTGSVRMVNAMRRQSADEGEDFGDGTFELIFVAENFGGGVKRGNLPWRQGRKHKDAFANRKAQLYALFAELVRNSWLTRRYFLEGMEKFDDDHEKALQFCCGKMGDRIDHLFIIDSRNVDSRLIKKFMAEAGAPQWVPSETGGEAKQVERKSATQKRTGVKSPNMLEAVIMAAVGSFDIETYYLREERRGSNAA